MPALRLRSEPLRQQFEAAPTKRLLFSLFPLTVWTEELRLSDAKMLELKALDEAAVLRSLRLSRDEAALLLSRDPASSLSDPQADATIARAARMTMNRFNMKRVPLCWLGAVLHPTGVSHEHPRTGPPS